MLAFVCERPKGERPAFASISSPNGFDGVGDHNDFPTLEVLIDDTLDCPVMIEHV